MSNTAPRETWALLPFYSPVDSDPQSVEQLARTVEFAGEIVDHTIVVVDGDKPVPRESLPGSVDLVKLPAHLGKAAAIRAGIWHITEKSANDSDLVVQIDSDFDQNPRDAIRFTHRYGELERTDHQPTLLIGDRFHNVKDPSIRENNQIRYRQAVNALIGGFTRELGYRVTDVQSGFRAYSVDLAKEFVEKGSSYLYGIEAEQVTLAMAKTARIEPVYLTQSRLRTASTDVDKWLQNVNGMLAHTDEFGNEKGVHGNLQQFWDSFEILGDAMQDRRDAHVTVPLSGGDQEFHAYMSDGSSYTLVDSSR